jgi:hypothetical protein
MLLPPLEDRALRRFIPVVQHHLKPREVFEGDRAAVNSVALLDIVEMGCERVLTVPERESAVDDMGTDIIGDFRTDIHPDLRGDIGKFRVKIGEQSDEKILGEGTRRADSNHRIHPRAHSLHMLQISCISRESGPPDAPDIPFGRKRNALVSSLNEAASEVFSIV